jgi:CRP-like cAMP-binding protein
MNCNSDESFEIKTVIQNDTFSDLEMQEALLNFNRSLLSGIPDELFENLTPYFEEKTFDKDTHLIREGECGDCIYVLISGSVKIYSRDEAGIEHVSDRSGPGDVLGEMSLLTGEQRCASVLAEEPVRALALPARTFHKLAQQHVALSRVMSNIVAKRLGAVEYDALSGKVLAGYQLKRRLGKGGMAVIYEAHDPLRNRSVALKMMSHRLIYDAPARQQFNQEFELVRSFVSPFIVQTYSRFEAFHTFFLVMEFCKGRSLDEIVQEGPSSESKIRQVLHALRKALQYAHDRGLIHRDVKPSNLIELESGEVKLMDFGLAVPIDELAHQKGISGTAGYLAPELLNKRIPSRQTDYFAAGMSLAELMLGRRIVRGKSFQSIVDQLRQWQPPNLAALCPQFSPELVDQVQRLISVDPNVRVFADFVDRAAPIQEKAISGPNPGRPPQN